MRNCDLSIYLELTPDRLLFLRIERKILINKNALRRSQILLIYALYEVISATKQEHEKSLYNRKSFI